MATEIRTPEQNRPDGHDHGQHQRGHDEHGHGHGHHHGHSHGGDPDLILTPAEAAQWLGASILLFVAGWVFELALDNQIMADVAFYAAIGAAAWTFFADIIAQPFSVATLMAIGAAGAAALGNVHEGATLAILFAVSEFIVHRTLDRTQGDLRGLLDLVPRQVTVLRDGHEHQVEPGELVPGDHMVVRPGERLATDGVVLSGSSAVDLSAVTGEPLPAEVHPGSAVYAAGVNGGGALVVEVTTPSARSSLTRLVELLEEAQANRGSSEQLVDRLAKGLIVGAVGMSLAVLAVGALTGDFERWGYRALMVLVAMSPCALAIAIPVTVLAAIGTAGRAGVLLKGGAVLESLARCQVAALDKTGTLTAREPRVLEVVPAPGVTTADVLITAAALEARSEHPLAAAVLAAAPGEPPPADDVTAVPGRGLTGTLAGVGARLGNPAFVDPGALAGTVERLQEAGATVVVVERGGTLLGLIAVRDELRPEAAEAVAGLAEAGIGHVAILTGDNRRAAAALGAACGVTDIRAELLPDHKVAAITELAARGPVLMVGDGINDAPALAAAETGVAMGAMGTDLAVEAADAALLGTDLRQLGALVAFARRSQRIVRQQLVLSALVVAGLVPLAVTGTVKLAVAVLVHELSGTLVVLAGLRAGRAGSLVAGKTVGPDAHARPGGAGAGGVLSLRQLGLTPRRAAVALALVAVVVAAAGILHSKNNQPNPYSPWVAAARPVLTEAFRIESDNLEVAAGETLEYSLDCEVARPEVDRVAARMPEAPDAELAGLVTGMFDQLRLRYDLCAEGDTAESDAAFADAQDIERRIIDYTIKKSDGAHDH